MKAFDFQFRYLRSRSAQLWLFPMFSLAHLTSVQAADICDAVAADPATGIAAVEALGGTLSADTGKPSCTSSIRLGGGRHVVCFWKFPYRAPQAARLHGGLNQKIGDCDAANALPVSDQAVNHPDTYDLKTFRLEKSQVSVSLKDKATLEETYVFVRIEPL